MATGNTTITLQAASDSTMTENNTSSGTALADDDCRKVYGLPHTFVAGPGLRKELDGERYGKKVSVTHSGDAIWAGYNVLIQNDWDAMVDGYRTKGGKGYRWDEVSPISGDHPLAAYLTAADYEYDTPSGLMVGGYGDGDVSITGLQTVKGYGFGAIDRRPTTTAFQLRPDTLEHQIADMSTVTPLPGTDWGAINSGTAGSPEQLDNFTFGVGLRQETITLSGVMIDRGQVGASNPRRQILLNIARTQYLKVRNAGSPELSENHDKNEDRSIRAQWGGRFAGPLNPRSYPCLTIFNQGLDDQWGGVGYDSAMTSELTRGDVEPDGAYKIYRGMIQSFSFTAEGGRPDFWRWQLQFKVMANEKRGLGLLADARDAVRSDGEDA